jgi:hypothetical protein
MAAMAIMICHWVLSVLHGIIVASHITKLGTRTTTNVATWAMKYD